MLYTPLCDKMAKNGALLGTYDDVFTAVSFGEPEAEFEALRSGCGVYDLGWRAKLAVTGPDRVRWLNGMVTNNVRDLAPDHGVYNFVLNAQGRILGDCYVYNRGEYLLVGTEHSQVENIKAIFDKFIIMDDVEVTDISDKLTAVAVQGPEARTVLERAGFTGTDAAPMELRDIVWQDVGASITRMASEDFVTYEIWCAPPNVDKVWDALREAGATPVGTEALETFRIAAGIPRYGQDIRERDLPQETRQDYALHYAKGCYIGQEIVERIRSRGQVHRVFSGFELGTEMPALGTKIVRDGKEIGEITSARRFGDRVLGLGYVRREASIPGTEVAVNGAKATVAAVPFPDSRASVKA